MRLGCCGSIDDAAAIKAAGFDFLEVNVQGVLRGDEPSSTWDKSAPDVDRLPLPIEAANSLVPAKLPIIGPPRDTTALQDYLQRVVKRAERLGIQRLVFGSGGARKRPEGVSVEEGLEQLIEFTRMAGEICAHHNVTLVIEHLHKGETNTLNSLAECRYVCEQVSHPSVAMLVDSFHYGMEQENDQAIIDLGNTLRHVHVAEPAGRGQPGALGRPGEGSKAFDFEHFFCLLQKIGYDERVSIECNWTKPMPEVAAATAQYLRDAWKNAGRCD